MSHTLKDKMQKKSQAKSRWWQTTTVYHIYPRSYMDSNNDGIGDLQGIIQKLDYIQDIGFETIWISPFFQSPKQDWGYDISDYYNIDPEYGNMQDVEKLIKEIHKRGMRVIFDLVMNHTSNQHRWFQESRSSIENPRRDWYIWRKGRAKEKPPNNWRSMIGKQGWQYDNVTDEWYFSNFLSFQPDLNYNNPEVKEEMFNIARFWLKQGVDGFRLDIFNAIYKDESFADNPFSIRPFPTHENHDEAFFQKKTHTLNHPRNYQLTRELRGVTEEYASEKMLIGEVVGSVDNVKRYLGENQDGLHLVFLFELVAYKFKAKFFRGILEKFEKHYPGPFVPTLVYGNHDQPRLGVRIKNDRRKAGLLALFQLTGRGVPVVYYGEEIGMADGDFVYENAKDPMARQYRFLPRWLVRPFKIYLNRDGCRTPMQWNDEPNAGFTGRDVEPWLPVHRTYKEVNVAAEAQKENSLLQIYKALLALRKTSPALREGALTLYPAEQCPRNVLRFRRHHEGEVKEILINFGKKERSFSLNRDAAQVLFSTNGEAPAPEGNLLKLPGYSGLVLG